MSAESAYLIGRAPGDWPPASKATSDRLFAAVRKDDLSIVGLEFEHCTFANVSFKGSTIEQSRFTNCAFIRCYFRKAQLISSSFTGCKFIDCEFPKVTIQSCDFRYCHFEGCAISFAEMEHSLPREPNIREDLAWALARSSDSIGHDVDGRQYRLAAIQARQEHLYSAVVSKSVWYQSHYPGLRRFHAFTSLVASQINGLVWGHGEKPWVLLRNVLVLSLIVFPLALWLVRDDLRFEDTDPTFSDVVWLSLTTIIPVGGSLVAVTGWIPRALLVLEGLVGAVSAGLLVAILVRRMLNR